MSLDIDHKKREFIPYYSNDNFVTIDYINFPTGVFIKNNEVSIVEYPTHIKLKTEQLYIDTKVNYKNSVISTCIENENYNNYTFQLFFDIPISLCEFIYNYSKQYDNYKWSNTNNDLTYLYTQKNGLLQTRELLQNSLYFHSLDPIEITLKNNDSYNRADYEITTKEREYNNYYWDPTNEYNYDKHPSVILTNIQLETTYKYKTWNLEVNYSFKYNDKKYSMKLTIDKYKLSNIGEQCYKHNEKEFEEKQKKYNAVFTN